MKPAAILKTKPRIHNKMMAPIIVQNITLFLPFMPNHHIVLLIETNTVKVGNFILTVKIPQSPTNKPTLLTTKIYINLK